MNTPLLILTSGFGDGHNAAANGLQLASRQIQPDAPATVHDLLLEKMPHFGKFLQKNYIRLVTNLPSVWRWLYTHMDKSGPTAHTSTLLTGITRKLGELIQERKPAALISTYPIYPVLIERLRRNGFKPPPIYTVITDSLAVNGMWVASPSKLFFTADDFTVDVLQKMGIPRHQIFPAGFPVNPHFVNIARQTPPPDTPPKILFFCHGTETDVAKELDSLLPLLKTGVHLRLALGRNASRLYHTVNRFVDLHPDLSIRVSGWLNNVPTQMGDHHILISKAGGATTHEAISAGIPIIIDSIIPGQEEGNADLLTRHGGGIIQLNSSQIGPTAEKLLAHGLTQCHHMRENLLRAGKPDAAATIIRHVIADHTLTHSNPPKLISK